jgi:ATP-dependent RNA circularization protein (DNA/RNA ligase family)
LSAVGKEKRFPILEKLGMLFAEMLPVVGKKEKMFSSALKQIHRGIGNIGREGSVLKISQFVLFRL